MGDNAKRAELTVRWLTKLIVVLVVMGVVDLVFLIGILASVMFG